MWFASRQFTQADQLAFAEWSWDWNPIHVDPVAARRTPFGQVVHGVHVAAWAVEQFLSMHPQGVRAITATFLRPVRPGDEVRVSSEPSDGDVLLTVSRNEVAFASIRIVTGADRFSAPAPQGRSSAEKSPDVLSPADAAGRSGQIALLADPQVDLAFPSLTAVLGGLRVAALFGLSRIVGMHCPGLYSLFSSLHVEFGADAAPTLRYEVQGQARPRAPIRIAVSGGGLSGHIAAFFRPQPVDQPDMTAIAEVVSPGEFGGQRALIVGGSRGLGEVVAKIIAAGGGRTTITYHVGADDARRVAEEIRKSGAWCQVAQASADSMSEVLGALAAVREMPTHIYYLASPPITATTGSETDGAVLQRFLGVYVEAFTRLCESVPPLSPVRIFYPSTVFIDDTPPGFAEYATAKAAGEAACRSMAAARPNLSFVVPRLPRLRTDQTSSFLDRPAPDPLPVMLDVVRAMNATTRL
jgi:hypothetical protein